MKILYFLALLFSSFIVVACEDDTESIVIGSTDKELPLNSSGGSTRINSNINPIGDDASVDCGTLDKIIVRGFFLRGWGGGGLNGPIWSGFPPLNALLTILNLSQDFGCNSGKSNRELYANMIFAQHSALALAEGMDEWAQFIAEHPNGSDYTINWPDGSTGTYYVTNPLSSSNPTHNETSLSGC